MNAGKLIAEIAVLAIIVYCCYDAVIDAAPSDIDNLSNPISIDEMNLSASTSGLQAEVDFDGKVTSNLPQDIVGVGVGVYIGTSDTRMEVGSLSNMTIDAESTTRIQGTFDIPMYAVLAYAADSKTTDTLSIPLCLELSFKYFKWQGSYLIDMSMMVSQPIEITSSHVDYAATPNNGAKITVNMEGGLIESIARDISPDTYTFECNGAEIVIDITSSGEFTFEAIGDSGKDANVVFQEYLDAHPEGLTLTDDDANTYELSKEQSETFIDLIQMIYEGVSA